MPFSRIGSCCFDCFGCLISVSYTHLMFIMIGIYVVFFAILYFIFFRPQNKRKKKEEAMRKNAEIGDVITTIGGICGRIVGIKDENTIVIETGSDRSKLQIKRWAIGSVETVHDDAE